MSGWRVSPQQVTVGVLTLNSRCPHSMWDLLTTNTAFAQTPHSVTDRYCRSIAHLLVNSPAHLFSPVVLTSWRHWEASKHWREVLLGDWWVDSMPVVQGQVAKDRGWCKPVEWLRSLKSSKCANKHNCKWLRETCRGLLRAVHHLHICPLLFS